MMNADTLVGDLCIRHRLQWHSQPVTFPQIFIKRIYKWANTSINLYCSPFAKLTNCWHWVWGHFKTSDPPKRCLPESTSQWKCRCVPQLNLSFDCGVRKDTEQPVEQLDHTWVQYDDILNSTHWHLHLSYAHIYIHKVKCMQNTHFWSPVSRESVPNSNKNDPAAAVHTTVDSFGATPYLGVQRHTINFEGKDLLNDMKNELKVDRSIGHSCRGIEGRHQLVRQLNRQVEQLARVMKFASCWIVRHIRLRRFCERFVRETKLCILLSFVVWSTQAQSDKKFNYHKDLLPWCLR